ncbi:MAG: GNAT family N-acetyltransferase, partial [Planctomycetaceae bacterium]|nr:GNAT family N-acetyltransferase [Planctomycetaceae bacterium]
MSDVIELNEIEALADYRADWQRLLKVTPGGTFFRSLEWLQVYWNHFAEDQRLRVLIVVDGGEVTGIVPLCVRRIKSKYGLCRILTFPFDDWGSFYGPVSASQKTTLCAAFNYILHSRRDWDLIDLRCVDSAGFDGGETEQALNSEKISFETLLWCQTAYVDLKQDWDQYLCSRSSRARKTYLCSEKRVQQEGEVKYLRYRPAGAENGESDPRWDLYDQCEEIARQSWQGRSTTGTTLSHASVAPFFRDAHERAAQAGTVDLNMLYVAGRPAAFNYNYVHEGLVYSLRMGFDPRVSIKGAGCVLMGRMIRDSMQRGDRILDIGPGSLAAKKNWYTSVENSYRYVHYSATSVTAKLM